MSKDDLREKYLELKSYTKVTRSVAADRGLQFQDLIESLFDREEILLRRSYYTSDNKSEQIDCAIQINTRVILVEVKWVESNIAASDLYAFAGKVQNKLEGTLGLFISKEKLSENFLAALSKGRRRNILVVHGDDVESFFDDDFAIKMYLQHILLALSIDNLNHYPASDFKNNRQRLITLRDEEKQLRQKKDEVFSRYLDAILRDDELTDHNIYSHIQTMNTETKAKVIRYLLQKYPDYRKAHDDFLLQGSAKLTNVERTLTNVLRLREVLEVTFQDYFKAFSETRYPYLLVDLFWDVYTAYRDKLPGDLSQSFHNAIAASLETYSGDYNAANIISKRVQELWGEFEKNTKQRLVSCYIDFLLSNRRPDFSQIEVGKRLLFQNKDDEIEAMVEEWIEHSIAEESQEYDIIVNDFERPSRSFAHRTKRLRRAVGLSEEEWKTYIHKKYRHQVENRQR